MNYCTIGVFAHANAGKTTVTENFLHYAGIIDKVGRVDTGTTITDNLGVEKMRGITIKSSFVTFYHEDTCFQLLDTPGHVDFSAEVVRAMSVLDAAIFVISGVEGIEAQTINIWSMLCKMEVPTLFFVNKLDRAGADYERVVNDLRTAFSKKIVNFQSIDVSNGISINELDTNHLLEQMADFDDVSTEKYLEEENVGYEWIVGRIRELYKTRDIFCVLGGSALAEIGVDDLLRKMYIFLPAYPKNKIDADFSGEVYMVKRNEGVRETYIKILRGGLSNRMVIKCGGEFQKIRMLYCMEGNRKIPIEEAETGRLVIVTGIETKSGELIGEFDEEVNTQIDLNPMFTAVLSIGNEEQKVKLWEAIKELNEEDSYLNARLDHETNDIQIDLMGKLQGETIVQLLEERYKLNAVISNPSIIYKETPIDESIGKASYTKTSNVALKILPLCRGEGIKFTSLLASDYLFTKYQKQVERLVHRYLMYGIYGWQITDVEVQLIGGKCDNVGSEPKDYNIATPIALSRAIKYAHTKLLEPIVFYSVTVPTEYYSEALGKLMTMRKGYDEIQETTSGNKVITGTAYLSEMIEFVDNIREITGGKGIANYSHIGYDEAITQEIIVNPINENNPYNERQFVLAMNGIMENLDKGLETKRGKPEKIKRNKHLWKNNKK